MNSFKLNENYYVLKLLSVNDSIFIPSDYSDMYGNETCIYYSNNNSKEPRMVMDGLVYFTDKSTDSFHRLVKPAVIQKHAHRKINIKPDSYMYGHLYQWYIHGNNITHEYFEDMIKQNINPFNPTPEEFDIVKLMWFS